MVFNRLVDSRRKIKRFESKSLEELYLHRNYLTKCVENYDSGKYDEGDMRCWPRPAAVYGNNKRFLEELNKLIALKEQEQGINDNQTDNNFEMLTNRYNEGLLTEEDYVEQVIIFYNEGLITDEEFATMKEKLIKK